MGREIRCVPPNWQHPTEMRFGWSMRQGWSTKLAYTALYDQTHADALAEWEAEQAKWEAGSRPVKQRGMLTPDRRPKLTPWMGMA